MQNRVATACNLASVADFFLIMYTFLNMQDHLWNHLQLHTMHSCSLRLSSIVYSWDQTLPSFLWFVGASLPVKKKLPTFPAGVSRQPSGLSKKESCNGTLAKAIPGMQIWTAHTIKWMESRTNWGRAISEIITKASEQPGLACLNVCYLSNRCVMICA